MKSQLKNPPYQVKPESGGFSKASLPLVIIKPRIKMHNLQTKFVFRTGKKDKQK